MQSSESNIESTKINSVALNYEDANEFDFSSTLSELDEDNAPKKQEKKSGDENSEIKIESNLRLDELNSMFLNYGFPLMSENYYNILDEKFFSESDNKKVDIILKNNMFGMKMGYSNLFISFNQSGDISCKEYAKSGNLVAEVKSFKDGNNEFITIMNRYNEINQILVLGKNKNRIIYENHGDYWQKNVEKNNIIVTYKYPSFDIVSPDNYMDYIDETLIWVKDGIPYEGKIDFSSIDMSSYEDYQVEGFSVPVKTRSGHFVVYPKLSQGKQVSVEKQNRSEGLNRKIGTIRVHKNISKELFAQVYMVTNELGIKLETVPSSTGQWIEDYSIRRHDGKIYIPPEDFLSSRFVSEERQNISNTAQGQVKERKDASNYSNILEENDIIRGKSYLEGGNVLNTIVNGKPGAIVGDESIDYSLRAMGLKDTEENREIVKRQIAEDLGIEYEQLTLIPQIDFHIDMIYRPLQDGTIAVPDYSLGIEMFSKLVPNNYIYKQQYLNGLIEIQNNANGVLQEAENILEKGGYKIRKIPSFTIPNERYKNLGIDKGAAPIINFMNGVGGITKNGILYFITNTSTFPELDKAMKKYFQRIGINKVYFLDTQEYLNKSGAFDCLTQEI